MLQGFSVPLPLVLKYVREMKKLLTVIIVLLVAVVMIMTRPEKKQHKDAMMVAIKEYVDEEAANKGIGDNILAKLGKGVVNKAIETALNSKLKMHDYYLFNTTYVKLDGDEQLLSVGLLGHVFTFDKKMLREKLEESLNAKEEEASEREAAKASEKEMKRLQKEQKKREKELAKEQERKEKEAAKAAKAAEKAARKAAKAAEKEARKRAKEQQKNQ